MKTYDFVQLVFDALGGEIKGKTKLQKIVYFVGLASGYQNELGYRAHFYGPYSDEVSEAVERLKTLGFLDQSVSGIGSVDSRGFEVARHDYRLNEAGKKMAEAKKREWLEDWKRIEKAANAMKKLFEQDYMKLSVAAKTWFMLEEMQKSATPEATPDVLAALAPKFGWSVAEEQITEAAKLLREAGLVELSQDS